MAMDKDVSLHQTLEKKNSFCGLLVYHKNLCYIETHFNNKYISSLDLCARFKLYTQSYEQPECAR